MASTSQHRGNRPVSPTAPTSPLLMVASNEASSSRHPHVLVLGPAERQEVLQDSDGGLCCPPGAAGCTMSPTGELIIDGLGVDGRNLLTGEAGWATTETSTRVRGQCRPGGSCGVKGRCGSTSSSCRGSSASFAPCSRPSEAGSSNGGLPSTIRNAWRRMGGTVLHKMDEENGTGDETLQFAPAPKYGVVTMDIAEGRTCFPISQLDFRAYLARLRRNKPQLSNIDLPDFSMLGGDAGASTSTRASAQREFGEKTLVDERDATRTQQERPGDELDAFEFLIGFERYRHRFALLRSPIQANSPDVVTIDEILVAEREANGERSTMRDELEAEVQPLRSRFDGLIDEYLGRRSASTDADTSLDANAKKRHAHSSSVVSLEATPRLKWMCEVGLLSDGAIQQLRARAQLTTHPDVLVPIVEAVAAHLDAHCLPDFLEESAHNLTGRTKMGRLAVGIVCTALAILFTVLLIVDPSPLTGERIVRWWRILTGPLWMAGLGYIWAAWTGVCVWLTLRGNVERDEAERLRSSMEAGRDASLEPKSFADEEALGLSSIDSATHAEIVAQQARSRGRPLMAPELERLLLRLIGRKPTAAAVAVGQDSSLSSWHGLGQVASAPGNILPMTSTDASSIVAPSVKITVPPRATPSRVPSSGSIPRQQGLLTEAPHLPTTNGVPLAEPRRLSTVTHAGTGHLTRSFSVPGLPVTIGISKAQQPSQRAPSVRSSRSGQQTATATKRPAAGVAKKSLARRSWESLKHWTGFAVDTEQILDDKIRRIHQMAALKSMTLVTLVTVIITVVIVAIP